jgi:hypothetical protein
MRDDDERKSSAALTPNPFADLAATAPPAVVEPEVLAEGLRYLQQRIPEFVQLSLREEQSMARAAYLDPEFIAAGLHAATVWAEAKSLVERTGEELRREDEDIRRWDEVERELRALTKGIAAANLKRKHHLGKAILTLYRVLGINLTRRTTDNHAHLRPYYEDMKRAYQKRLKRRKANAEE